MSKKSNHRLTHGSRTRRVLRAAVTIGTATTIFCGTYPFDAQAAITSGPEVEALKQLKMDYFANVDLNNWPALYQQFTPNALIDASDSLPGDLANTCASVSRWDHRRQARRLIAAKGA